MEIEDDSFAPKLFPNQSALVVLGTGDDVETSVCLRLALEGCQVIGLGFDGGKLKQIKRDVEDVKGSFSYFVVTPSNRDKIVLNIFDKFNGVNFIITLLTKTGITWFLGSALDMGGEIIGTQTNALTNFFYHFCNEYKKNIKTRKKVTRIVHIIDVISLLISNRDGKTVIARSPAELRASSLDLMKERERMKHSSNVLTRKDTEIFNEVRLSRVYLKNVNTTVSPGNEENISLFPSFFSPALVVNEMFHLLSSKEYQTCNDISIHRSGQDVYASLHVPDQKGVLDFTKPMKQFKRGTALNTYLKETPDRGKGIFAARDFHRGEVIAKTTGKVLKHQTEHSLQIGWDRHLEPDPPVRWINHSCEPNAGVITNIMGFPDIVAFRDIQADEEITFDYAMTEFKHYERENPEMEFDLTCRCGSENCRGKLGYYSELPEGLKKKYEGFISEYLIKGENS